MLQHGSKSDQEQAQRLRVALGSAGSERADIYLQLFLTTTLEPRKSVVTKAIETHYPQLAERLCAERTRVLALVERHKAVACRDRTAALITIADAVISRYEAAKDRRGLLDYDDLIDKTLALLGEERAGWVHYKLDRGIDHVLIDEAQDTSPKQWEIIRRLTAEFFAGAGARAVGRTISRSATKSSRSSRFKAPRRANSRSCVAPSARSANASNMTFGTCTSRISFRSGPNVLGAVDDVFAQPAAFAGLSADAVKTVHEPLPDATPGMVEIGPPSSPRTSARSRPGTRRSTN